MDTKLKPLVAFPKMLSESSIVKWGYQDNFRPVYFFYYE